MPASFSIPPNDPYQGTIAPLESRLLTAPREGNRMVPLSINWGNDSATLQALAVNLQNATTNPFSQIVAMSVNNLMSNVDAVFMFPDTGWSLTIPAQSEALCIPVDTNALNFVVKSAGGTGSTEDVLYIELYNYLPFPVSVPRTFVQSVAKNIAVTMVAGTTVIIPHTDLAGIITSIEMQAYNLVGGAAASDIAATLQGGIGASNFIDIGLMTIPAAAAPVGPVNLLMRNGLSLPFRTGVDLVLTVSTPLASGILSTVLNYR